MNDWSDYWIKRDMIDLRDNKYLQLKKKESLFLGVAPRSSKGIFLDFSKPLNFERRYNPAYGKNSYTMKKIKNRLKSLDSSLEELIDFNNDE